MTGQNDTMMHREHIIHVIVVVLHSSTYRPSFQCQGHDCQSAIRRDGKCRTSRDVFIELPRTKTSYHHSSPSQFIASKIPLSSYRYILPRRCQSTQASGLQFATRSRLDCCIVPKPMRVISPTVWDEAFTYCIQIASHSH